MQTDACGSAVAAELLQDFRNGRKPTAYASRSFSKAVRKYSLYELEALAVLFGIEKFCLYLVHTEFGLHTNNQALSYVLAQSDGHCVFQHINSKFHTSEVHNT